VQGPTPLLAVALGISRRMNPHSEKNIVSEVRARINRAMLPKQSFASGHTTGLQQRTEALTESEATTSLLPMAMPPTHAPSRALNLGFVAKAIAWRSPTPSAQTRRPFTPHLKPLARCHRPVTGPAGNPLRWPPIRLGDDGNARQHAPASERTGYGCNEPLHRTTTNASLLPKVDSRPPHH